MMGEGAFYTGCYPNMWKMLGYTDTEIDNRVNQTFETLFYGTEEERIYHEAGPDMGYLEDTGNHDVRTEGMSYGMMMCVQMNRQKEFDRIWKWAKTYMYMEEGENAGYFAWSCLTDGTRNSCGPAPDGEEYFAMALFFASHRWGDREGIFCYSREAREILRTCIHKGEDGAGHPMWNPDNHLILFVPGCWFTDPSYHLPHFYELFALWAYEEDRPFWKEAAAASRNYLKLACHPGTGLCAEYSTCEGIPVRGDEINGERHDWYYSDAYRTIANIALDHVWFGKDPWQCEIAGKLQCFYDGKADGDENGVFECDGIRINEKARHPVAVIAVNAQSALASGGKLGRKFLEKLWNTPLRTGDRRYYDNCLYMFAMLALSGKYRIWDKKEENNE